MQRKSGQAEAQEDEGEWRHFQHGNPGEEK
jgi:hypothetical protein